MDEAQLNQFSFSTLLDIDKLTQIKSAIMTAASFSTLLDIDKLTQKEYEFKRRTVLVLCWILINLHK